MAGVVMVVRTRVVVCGLLALLLTSSGCWEGVGVTEVQGGDGGGQEE